jgi:hypothetical protein
MKRAIFLILAGMLSAGSAIARPQSEAGTQAGASAASSTSADASRSGGVSAANNSSAAASAQHNDAQVGSSSSNSTAASASKSGAEVNNSAVDSDAAKTSHGSAASSSASTMNATLVHSVDAKKNKPGDAVTARTTRPSRSPDGTALPKGTELVGHVTQAQARSKGQSESDLGIVFDKAILKNGQEVPMNATIQAIAAAQNTASADAADEPSLSTGSMAGGAGLVGGGGGAARGGVVSGAGAVGGATSVVGGAAAGVTGQAGRVGNVGGSVADTQAATANLAGSASRGTVGGLNATGQLASNSQGVFNMQGLSLASSASSATQGSVIASTTRNVHLDSGTQFLLSAAGDAQIAASK